jgi:glycerate kinase
MKILIAADKFKGSLTAREACEAIRDGLEESPGGDAEIRILPIADGGDGMARSMLASMGGIWKGAVVSDAMGHPVLGGYALVGDDRDMAVIEMAEASGLWRMDGEELDPWKASTFGTGELIKEAVKQGVTRILLGIGGSATNDAGTGMAQELGYRFLNSKGEEIAELPEGLESVHAIERDKVIALPKITVACDVNNPLLGERGCTRVYGPQKGVKEEDFDRFEKGLEQVADVVERDLSCDFRNESGAGAAGGMGFGALAFLGAELKEGFPLVAEEIGLRAAIEEADLVITGEGSLDEQSLDGKAPVGVARMAKELGKPVAAFAGKIDEQTELGDLFVFHRAISGGDVSIDECMTNAFKVLEKTVRNAAEELKQKAG